RSFWIDEALTAVKAMQPTFNSWWQAMAQEKASDLQMPLYMFYAWAYEKPFGSGEWALRLANLPWFLLGAVSFIRAFSSRPGAAGFFHNDQQHADEGVHAPCLNRTWTGTLLLSFSVLFSPFAWYYLDEARPYAMQIGAGLMIAAALFRL